METGWRPEAVVSGAPGRADAGDPRTGMPCLNGP